MMSSFSYVEPDLHTQDEAYLLMMGKLLDVLFAGILLKIFVLMFIMDIGLKFSFLVVSLPGFGIRMMLVS